MAQSPETLPCRLYSIGPASAASRGPAKARGRPGPAAGETSRAGAGTHRTPPSHSLEIHQRLWQIPRMIASHRGLRNALADGWLVDLAGGRNHGLYTVAVACGRAAARRQHRRFDPRLWREQSPLEGLSGHGGSATYTLTKKMDSGPRSSFTSGSTGRTATRRPIFTRASGRSTKSRRGR